MGTPDPLVPGNDLAPHSAFLTVTVEVRERRPDGKFQGSVKDRDRALLEFPAQDRALAVAAAAALLADLREKMKASHVRDANDQA